MAIHWSLVDWQAHPAAPFGPDQGTVHVTVHFLSRSGIRDSMQSTHWHFFWGKLKTICLCSIKAFLLFLMAFKFHILRHIVDLSTFIHFFVSDNSICFDGLVWREQLQQPRLSKTLDNNATSFPFESEDGRSCRALTRRGRSR